MNGQQKCGRQFYLAVTTFDTRPRTPAVPSGHIVLRYAGIVDRKYDGNMMVFKDYTAEEEEGKGSRGRGLWTGWVRDSISFRT